MLNRMLQHCTKYLPLQNTNQLPLNTCISQHIHTPPSKAHIPEQTQFTVTTHIRSTYQKQEQVTDDRNFYVIFSIIISSKMTKTGPNTKENLQKQEKASRQSPRCEKTRNSPKSEEIQHSIAARCVPSCHDESSLHAKQSEEINLEKIFHRSTMPYNAVR
ncbi:hypothetical protein QL285_077252 [Trifolium repens]|nr:hypothetical protein QL285_077252 [Trifolium repens]